MTITRLRVLPALLAGLVATASVEARVTKLTVEKRRPVANGTRFGMVGAYERLDGTASFEVDPKDPLNAVIVDLDKAPRNKAGRVEFSTSFFIIKPVDMAAGNRKILYAINNRGNPIEVRFQTLPVPEPTAGPEAHDGLFFRLGYTIVDAGWAGDIVTTETRLGASLPVAKRPDGSPIVAPIRMQYQGSENQGAFSRPLKGNTQFRTYETADTDPSHAMLTVRDGVGGARRTVPATGFAFGRCPKGRETFVQTTTDLCVFEGFKEGQVFELVYRAKNPWVMGLGYVVTRDLAAFLRNDARDSTGQPNPLTTDGTSTQIRRVYGLGTSSTGMYLREFLYLGFNEDEAHRKVFDAVRILIPGTHRLFANTQFSDPNVYSRQDQHNDFLSNALPPFTYAVTTDPITGVRDGILKRPKTDPLLMHVDSANEFWQMKASLNVHDGRGGAVPIPDTVRLYFAASHAHVGASGVGVMPTSVQACTYPVNGNLSYNVLLRALVVALDDWADRGIAPPASRYPTIADGTLVTREILATRFPAIPGVRFPPALSEVKALDFGPRFSRTGGLLSRVPPSTGRPYALRLPAVDEDGLDLGGIRTLDIAVPVGTNTGWNLWAPGPKGNDLCGLSGSFFPFPRTAAQRKASGDPRRSLEERYTDHAGFVKAVEQAAGRLVADRFLLPDDAKTLMETASASPILR